MGFDHGVSIHTVGGSDEEDRENMCGYGLT